jgi:hypothetical protein
MLKSIVFSSLALILLSSVALATDLVVPDGYKYMQQDFTIGALNVVQLVGDGEASCINTATIIQDQQDCTSCAGASQDTLALFIQEGGAVGRCSASAVAQEAIVAGNQWQLVGGGCAPKMQAQGLGVVLAQVVAKDDGFSVVGANHTLAVVQNQGAGSMGGMMSESNVVVASQDSMIAGACANGTVTSGLTVTTDQIQMDL